MRCNARDCADSATGSRRARSKLRPRCCVPRCRTASPHVRVDAWVYRRKFSATSAAPDPASAAALLGQREAEGIDARPAFGEHHAAVHLRHRDVIKDPSVSAQVLKYRPFFILGEVQRPGQYAYVPGMSVLTAVSIAGGYTFRADSKSASITRNEGDKIIKGQATPQTPVMPGDTVFVPEDWF